MATNGVIPPGGMAGFSQMTPASRLALFPPTRSATRSTRRRKATSGRGSSQRKRARRASTSAKSRKMRFGSPAWQRKYRVGKFAKKRR